MIIQAAICKQMGVKDEISVGWHEMTQCMVFSSKVKVTGSEKHLCSRAQRKYQRLLGPLGQTAAKKSQTVVLFHDQQYKIPLKIEGKTDETAKYW